MIKHNAISITSRFKFNLATKACDIREKITRGILGMENNIKPGMHLNLGIVCFVLN
jgi:hypothetical protein